MIEQRSFDDGVEVLSKLTFDPAAEMTFDLLRGALVWHDEYVSGLRGQREFAPAFPLHWDLIVYRSALIREIADDDRRRTWERAREAIPSYPVFRVERRDRSLRTQLEEWLETDSRDFIAVLERFVGKKKK